MKVEIWADVICPWRGRGTHHLDAALEQFAHRDQFEVIPRSFELDRNAVEHAWEECEPDGCVPSALSGR